MFFDSDRSAGSIKVPLGIQSKFPIGIIEFYEHDLDIQGLFLLYRLQVYIISIIVMKLFQLNPALLISTTFTDEILKLVKIISSTVYS